MRATTRLVLLLSWLVLLLTAASCGGCLPRARPVEVVVRNDADAPVLLWLCKVGPPVESGWLTPGQLAAYAAPGVELAEVPLEELPAAVLGPGRTATLGPRSGRFDGGGRPVLRVFPADWPGGTATLADLAGVPKRSPLVDEVFLTPGGRAFVTVTGVAPVLAGRVPASTFGIGPVGIGPVD